MTFRDPWGFLGKLYSGLRKQPVRKPWGRPVPGVLEEPGGGPCDCCRVSEGTGQVMQSLVSCGEDLNFYPEGGGGPGGFWAEEGWDLTQCSQESSDGCCREDRLGD